LLTNVITSRTRTDVDDDRGNAIDVGRGAHAIGNAATTTTRRQCALCARYNSANGRRNGRRNDVRCGGGVSGDATMASTSQVKGVTAPNQNRRDEGDATMMSQEKLKWRGDVATRQRTSMIDAGGANGERRGTTAARRLINKKLPTLLNNTIFLAPPSRICPSQA
jgi:hypothetical protein